MVWFKVELEIVVKILLEFVWFNLDLDELVEETCFKVVTYFKVVELNLTDFVDVWVVFVPEMVVLCLVEVVVLVWGLLEDFCVVVVFWDLLVVLSVVVLTWGLLVALCVVVVVVVVAIWDLLVILVAVVLVLLVDVIWGVVSKNWSSLL